jgi:hypothetical protein
MVGDSFVSAVTVTGVYSNWVEVKDSTQRAYLLTYFGAKDIADIHTDMRASLYHRITDQFSFYYLMQ